MYRLCVWVQYMQGATTTPLTVNCPKSRTGSPQSMPKMLHFFHLSFKMKIEVHHYLGRIYRLFVWVQSMQGATTTPLTANCPKSRPGSPQSIPKILPFLRILFEMKAGVHRQCGGY